MKTQRPELRFAYRILGGALLGVLMIADAPAQTYPARTVTMIVPHAAGGSTDILARMVGQKLSESWRQQVVIDNRPGAGGTIGTAYAAKAPADGYSVVVAASNAIVINPSLYRKLPFDPVRDFLPVTEIATLPMILALHSAVPSRTVRELVALAKSRPGDLNYGSGGNGSVGHIAGEMFKTAAGVNVVHVPYKGSTPAVNDLVGGHVALIFAAIPPLKPHIESGKLRALAVTVQKRSSEMPEIPTMDEAGIPDFEMNFWTGLLAPAGTPNPIVDELHTAVVRVLSLPDVRKRFVSLGAEPSGSSPAQFAAAIRRDIPKYARVVKEAGIRVD